MKFVLLLNLVGIQSTLLVYAAGPQFNRKQDLGKK